MEIVKKKGKKEIVCIEKNTFYLESPGSIEENGEKNCGMGRERKKKEIRL